MTDSSNSSDQMLVSASGDELHTEETVRTERSEERHREDANYVPVIVKRIDEAKVHPDDILERAIHEGEEQLDRSRLSLFLSALAAGLILGFSAMAVAIMSQVSSGLEPLAARVVTALVYPLGFVICIMSGTQLFTEHTATAVYPVLDGKSSLRKLISLWITIICGNLIGALCSSLLISQAEAVIGAQSGYLSIAEHLIHHNFLELLMSAVLAGWLMAQGAWLVLATSPNTSQILCIYLVTFLIGIGGLHHSIVGSAEIFAAMAVGGPSLKEGAYFISTALLGNLIGGSVFVAILNYAHIRKTQQIN